MRRSVFCTIVNAVSLALMDAGVAMYDMISACSVGLVKNSFCLDVTQLEQNAGGAYIPIVTKARSSEILFMQLDSRLSLDKLAEAMEVGMEGCKQIKEYLESAIKQDRT
jgi:exosome complex component RRP41